MSDLTLAIGAVAAVGSIAAAGFAYVRTKVRNDFPVDQPLSIRSGSYLENLTPVAQKEYTIQVEDVDTAELEFDEPQSKLDYVNEETPTSTLKISASKFPTAINSNSFSDYKYTKVDGKRVIGGVAFDEHLSNTCHSCHLWPPLEGAHVCYWCDQKSAASSFSASV